MPRTLRSLGQIHVSAILAVMLAASTLMAAACDVAPLNPLHGANVVGDGDDPSTSKDKPPPGSGVGDGYDPGAPTNQGPSVNPKGFAAVAPIFATRCLECHHASTWLDLAVGADAATADKIVKALEAGTMPPAPRAAIPASELAAIKAWRDGQSPTVTPVDDRPSTIPVRQLVADGTLAAYKAALPKVAWPRLAAILASPSTLFYDKQTVPGAYQDTVGDGSSLPFGARLNSQGKSLIVPEGKKLFSTDGSTWAFPFGHTAGTDDSTNAFVVDFVSLPEVSGKLAPIAYKVEQSSVSSLPVTRWTWAFPKGTVVGEIVMVKDGAALLTTEIRVRERQADKWSTNVFRPFPTAKTLTTAIKAKRPQWASNGALKAAVDGLEGAPTLAPKHLDSPAFSNMVTIDGATDAPLPSLGDDALVRELLTSTPFVSAYGTTWRTNGTLRAFGPTGPAQGLSIVPTRFDSGVLEVRESTCTKCHDQGGTFIGGLVDQAILYGDIWGVDRIFSFHPFVPSRIDASGAENRSVRPELAGVFERYDAAVHAGYTFYRAPAP